MYNNNLFTGSKLLDRIMKVSRQKYGTAYEDIGLVTLHTKDGEPYFILNDNAMDKIGTVNRREIKQFINKHNHQSAVA